MKNSNTQTPESFDEDIQDKTTVFQTQYEKFREYLSKHTATAEMVAKELDIYHANLCRYKRKLQKAGKLVEVYKAHCKVTRFRAWYLSTDPEKIPQDSQLNLFPDHG